MNGGSGVCARACVCVCVCKRERETDRQRQSERGWDCHTLISLDSHYSSLHLNFYTYKMGEVSMTPGVLSSPRTSQMCPYQDSPWQRVGGRDKDLPP